MIMKTKTFRLDRKEIFVISPEKMGTEMTR
jgi:hypothetical protein